jgi:hypothetical protein
MTNNLTDILMERMVLAPFARTTSKHEKREQHDSWVIRCSTSFRQGRARMVDTRRMKGAGGLHAFDLFF